jgi:hypothetical protein
MEGKNVPGPRLQDSTVGEWSIAGVQALVRPG